MAMVSATLKVAVWDVIRPRSSGPEFALVTEFGLDVDDTRMNNPAARGQRKGR
jgi:hypothetical protein